MRAMAGAILLLVAAFPGPGCYSSESSPADSADTAPRDGRDAAGEVGTDSEPDTAACTMPQYWQVETLEIDRLEDISAGPVAAGRSARVQAWVNTGPRGCRERGRVLVNVDPTDRRATITVLGWTNVDALAGPCPPPEPTRVVGLLSGLTAGTWTVIDGSAGAADPVAMTLEVLPCTGTCSCAGPPENRGEGVECELDCQCAEGLACVGSQDRTGRARYACLRSCTDDGDCPRYQVCTDIADGPYRVCQDAAADRCTPPGGCGPGETCGCYYDGHPCRCEPTMTSRGPWCCRSEDCAPGQECIDECTTDGPSRRCEVRCRSDFDCPANSFCSTAPSGCGAGTCVPIED